MTDVSNERQAQRSGEQRLAVKPAKSSFSIDPYSREAIRRGARWYGVTQGDIVNLAPLLHALIADRSFQSLSFTSGLSGLPSRSLSRKSAVMSAACSSLASGTRSVAWMYSPNTRTCFGNADLSPGRRSFLPLWILKSGSAAWPTGVMRK